MDTRLYQMEINLKMEIENILVQKKKLLNEFQKYAKEKYMEIGNPFEIKYSLMNGNPNIKYADLGLGDDMLLEIVSFKYNPKSNIVSDHTKKIYRGKKIMADFIQNLSHPGNSYEGEIKEPHPLEKTDSIDKEKVETEKEKKTNELLMAIFEGKLVFNDAEYKRLVITNIALEQELERLNTRLAALQIITGSNFNQEKNKQI